VDTNMLILAGKGDSLLYFFEVDEGKSKATLGKIQINKVMFTRTTGEWILPACLVVYMPTPIGLDIF